MNGRSDIDDDVILHAFFIFEQFAEIRHWNRVFSWKFDHCRKIAADLTEICVVELRDISDGWILTTSSAIFHPATDLNISKLHAECIENYHSLCQHLFFVHSQYDLNDLKCLDLPNQTRYHSKHSSI